MSADTNQEIPRRLRGRVALVTGGGSGIGRAICLRLAAEGALVVAGDLDPAAGEATANLVREAGGAGYAVSLDVADYEGVRRGVDEVRKRWGAPNVLVNNAGWDRMEPFVRNTPDFWTRVIDINFRGAIHCARAVLDDMIQAKAGKIVSISSDAARVGSTGEAVYSGCKGGIIAFSKTLAREVARYGINVNIVCPGPTETPLLQGMVEGGSEKLVEALTRAIPFRRLAQPHEIAAAVAFFVSPDADYVTGQVLSVSGGLTMVG